MIGRNLKVLHFFKTYYPDTFGGVEQVIYQLAESGHRFGIDAEVLSLSSRGNLRDQPVANHKAHYSLLDFYIASTGFSRSAFNDFKELVAQVDLVHYHFPWPLMDLVHFVSKLQKPSVLTYHSDIVKQKALLTLYKPLMHRFLNSVGHIVATSPNYLTTSPTLTTYQNKVSVIPIGLDKLAYSPATAARLQHWKSALGEKFFLFVGALRYYKGLHVLLDAMSRIDYPVGIIGIGPLEEKLKQQANKLGLRNIHFLGALPDEDKHALLELCYGVVFPSHLRSEAFGISLLEGAMYGKPLISCEIGTGTTFINIDGETGLVIPPLDAKALRQAMTALWSNPSQARMFGQKALQRYQELFTADHMAAQYASVYRTVTASFNKP